MLLLTGRSIDAHTALAWGLVEELANVDSLDTAVARCVDDVLACGPLAVRMQKRLIESWMDRPVDEAITDSIAEFVAACAGPERIERMRAHLASRGR
jgi:enoyl-CoA hydratase/carnithine racemase